MNAIQFIKEKGVDKARGVVSKHAECYMPEVFKYWSEQLHDYVLAPKYAASLVSDLKRLVESVEVINKFDSVQEAKDAISNSPDGATDYRKLSCSTRYIKQSERFFEYWDGSIWCRPAVPFTDETHILRFTELSRLKQAITDYESIYSGEEH